MMEMAGARRGKVSKETFLLCVAGLLMTAFQVRFAQDSNLVKAFSILFSGAVVLVSILLLNGEKRVRTASPLLLVYFLIFLLSYATELFFSRSSEGVVKVIGNTLFLSFAFVFSYFIFSRKRYSNPDFFLKLLVVNVSVYVSINFFLYSFGLRRAWSDQFLVDYESGSAVMLGGFGVAADRVVFLLSNGINSYAPVAGMLLGLSFLSIKKSILFPILFVVSLISCLLIDSRSSIFYPALALGFAYWVAKGDRWKSGFSLVALLPLLPFFNELLFFVLGLILGDQTFLSRSDSDAGSLNGRYIIWAAIYNVFSNFELAQIFGYGNAGQIASGATEAISATQEFSNYLSPEGIGAHNTYLQVLLNYGYLGFVFYIFLFFSIFNKIKKLARSGVLLVSHKVAILFVFYEIMLFNNTEVGVIPPGQLFLPIVFLASYLLLSDVSPRKRVF